MKLSALLRTIVTSGQATAPVVGTVSSLAVALGVLYLVDCRFLSGRDTDSCYLTAAALAGIGVGTQAGYNTYNPLLRRPEEDHHITGPKRDEHGRFTK